MTSISVTAHRWEHGWELEIEPDHITQVRTLDRAAQQVRDYLDTLDPDVDHSELDVQVTADLGSLTERVDAARAAARDAERRQRVAAQQTRQVVAALRAEHISGTDIATILGVSRGRVSQLSKGQHAASQ